MALLKPNTDLGWIRNTSELERQLVKGDGISWPGDPDLSLSQGVIQAQGTGWDDSLKRIVRNGDIVARRWEVWRHTESGEDVMLGYWRIEEYDQIIWDLARMRADAPGHVDVADRLDAADDAKQAVESAKFRDTYGAMFEHAARLEHDRNNPQVTFRGIPGRRDEPKP